MGCTESSTAITDIYAGNQVSRFAAPLPMTTEVLTRLIRDHNSLSGEVLQEGQTIQIPPLPARAASGPALENNCRYYDPTNSEYYISAGAPVDLQRSFSGFVPAQELGQFRMAGETIIPVTNEQVTQISQLNGRVVPIRMARVELLQDSECTSADLQFEASPYLAAARTRMQNLLPRIEAAAASKKLGLVDFDFDAGHGARVRSAALWVLEKLGIRADLEPYVENIDLTRREENTDTLQAMITSYSKLLQKFGQNDQQVRLAGFWTFEETDSAIGESFRTIPAAMMSAALWQYLSRGDYLNLSWKLETEPSIRPFRMAEALRENCPFVIVAAGNRNEEVRADLFPQSEASIFLSFVNVTYGARDGRLYGSRTSAREGGKVDLLAPGCGIKFGSLDQDNRGSSFASPIVAAAAWVKALVDSLSTNELRSALIHASLLVPPGDDPSTISGGYFDAARLFAPLRAHYLDATLREIFPLADVAVNAGDCGSFSSVQDRPASQDLIVYERDNKYFVLWRHDVQEFPGVRVEPPCETARLTLEATGPDGPVTFRSPEAFVEAIGHLTF